MHEKVLPPGGRSLLDALGEDSSPALEGWVLAGGTGLALRLGHRVSADFDFFRTGPIDVNELHAAFKRAGPYETLQEAEHALTVMANAVKMSFFTIAAPFLFESEPCRFFSIADVRDIALMKLIAISGRGSRKDFVDLYTILRTGMILRDYFDLLPQRYGRERVNTYHILKSLTYFEDAEEEPPPEMLEPFDWDECKAFFVREAHSIVLPPSAT